MRATLGLYSKAHSMRPYPAHFEEAQRCIHCIQMGESGQVIALESEGSGYPPIVPITIPLTYTQRTHQNGYIKLQSLVSAFARL